MKKIFTAFVKKVILTTLPLFFLIVSVQSQITYTSVSIPMRDGEFLAADYYLPSTCTSCPVILIQTPYNKNWFHAYLPLGIGTNLPNSNYAFVVVDWRGFYGSAGALNGTPNRGEDGYDVIDWIAQQSWCDGNVGTWGPSALGKIQYETAKEQHPNHICAVPLVADPVFKYEDYFPGGVYRTEYVQQLDALGYGLSTTLLSNPVKNMTWTFLQNQSTYPSQITIPFFMIGGWFDHNVDGMLNFFNLLKTQSPIAVRDKHKLLMGPWAHGGNGSAYVGSLQQGEWQFPVAEGMNDVMAMDFFDYYLRGMTNNNWTVFDNYDSYEFETGYESANFDLRNWSVFTPTNFYLNPNGKLGSMPTSTIGDTTIIYDPRNPSPTIGGPTLRQDLDQGPYDQALVVETRNDIAQFSTDPIVCPSFHIYGKPQLHLFVSSDRKDTDFAVRLTITKYSEPQKSIIIADAIKRLRFRDGYTAADTSVGVPGQIYELIIDLPHVSHGYGADILNVDITSSNYPRFDANLNNGGTMYVAGDTLIANNTIYYNSNYPSYITLPLYVWGDVNENEISKILNTFPNPTNNTINLELPTNEKWNIVMVDISGKIISSENYTGEKYITNVSGLANGIYFLQLKNESGQNFHSRFIKQ